MLRTFKGLSQPFRKVRLTMDIVTTKSPFDSIRRFDGQGNEYWLARDLMPLLGYLKWERFVGSIDRAKIACQNSGNIVSDHFFPEAGKSLQSLKTTFGYLV